MNGFSTSRAPLVWLPATDPVASLFLADADRHRQISLRFRYGQERSRTTARLSRRPSAALDPTYRRSPRSLARLHSHALLPLNTNERRRWHLSEPTGQRDKCSQVFRRLSHRFVWLRWSTKIASASYRARRRAHSCRGDRDCAGPLHYPSWPISETMRLLKRNLSDRPCL